MEMLLNTCLPFHIPLFLFFFHFKLDERTSRLFNSILKTKNRNPVIFIVKLVFPLAVSCVICFVDS
jgi:hypothetical protein